MPNVSRYNGVLAVQLQAEQVLVLLDAQDHEIGQMIVQRQEGDLLRGQLTPGPRFAQIRPLFQDFEEAVNCQALGVVDKLDVAIAALGLHFRAPGGMQTLNIQDVQIWSDGTMTCRLREPGAVVVNGSLGAVEAAHTLRQ